jgi:hypothetical protein
LADSIRDLAAHVGIDLVKDQERNRVVRRQGRFDGLSREISPLDAIIRAV